RESPLRPGSRPCGLASESRASGHELQWPAESFELGSTRARAWCCARAAARPALSFPAAPRSPALRTSTAPDPRRDVCRPALGCAWAARPTPGPGQPSPGAPLCNRTSAPRKAADRAVAAVKCGGTRACADRSVGTAASALQPLFEHLTLRLLP